MRAAWAMLAVLVLAPPLLAWPLLVQHAHAQQVLTRVIYLDPATFADGYAMPAPDQRVLYCGTRSGKYVQSMLVPSNRVVSAAELRKALHVTLDRTHYCVATAILAGREGAPSAEIRFFCSRIGTGPAHQRRVECFIGDRVPPGQLGRQTKLNIDRFYVAWP